MQNQTSIPVINIINSRLEEAEMKKILDQRKRDKEEERVARQRVKDQIESDKAARKAKFAAPGENIPAPVEVKAAPTVVKAPPAKNYNETRLQVKTELKLTGSEFNVTS